MANVSNEVEVRSSKNIFSAARTYLIDSLHELNLFSDDPFWSSILKHSEQISSTRLFLILTSISLLTVIIYSSLSLVTHDVTLKTFSLNDFERLEKLYPHTISAPCNEVSIPYNKFLNLSPIFHQVCSSPFIGNQWISSLFLLNATSHNILDYRTFGFAQYRSLRLLCRLSRQSVKDSHRTFYFTHLINRHAFSRIQFNEIASVLSNNLQRNILTKEKRTVNIISMITAQNRLISGLRTNYYIESKPGSRRYFTYNGVYLVQNQTENVTCDCRFKANQCVYPAGAFYNWTLPDLAQPAKNNPPPLFQIPGLMAGCIPLDSMRQSSLECLYNQTCINMISLQPKISQPKSLNISLTRFPLDFTIGRIFDESLFVEFWQNESNFENYFSACAPQFLSYSYQHRFHFGTILTLSLSAFGGLVIVCKLITPIFIKIFNLIKRKKRSPSSLAQTSIELQMLQMAPKKINTVVRSHVNRTIHNFNLFPSENKNNVEEEYIGIISTRLYIVLIVVALVILGFYTSLSEHNQTNIIENPSLSKFEELNSLYSSTLNCPCSRFSMSYGRIMSLSPRYHSICSSEYLKDYWLSYFGHVEINVDKVIFLTTDFRVSGQSFFDLINILCQTSTETIQNALIVFKTNRLVTMNTLSYKQFCIEIQTRLELFQQQTISSFVHLIQLIRSAIQTNQLAEEMWTNVGPYSIYNNETSKWSLVFRPRDFYTNFCSCALSNECTRPVGFYFQTDVIRSKPNITVPGLVLGCYAIDSLLLSTLECFYDKKCVQLLIDNYYFNVIGLVKPLDDRAVQIKPLSHENSRFSSTTTINEIFSQLFVEDWINSSNFTSYYTQCKPLQCTYIIRKRFDTAYMLAMMLGFYGGLSAILEIILPPIVKLFIQRWKKRNKQIQPDYTNIRTTDSTINPPPKIRIGDVYRRFFSLNFFVSNPSLTEKQFENQERTATRIFILLFVLSMFAALLYCGPFSEETESIKLENPSIDVVNNLHKKNLSSLSCPCSKVAIRYSKFLSIKSEFNSICSSEFISPLYRFNLLKKNDSTSLELITHYRILSSLCDLSDQFIKNAEKVFDNRELITIETLTNSSFNTQIQSLILNFIRQTKSDYRRTFSFIIKSFSVNQLLHLFTNNWKIDLTNETEKYLIKTFPKLFSPSNCTCAISTNCNEQLTDDIRIGCFPYDGFRLSKFNNISLEKLNNHLFVQKWINQTNYTNYFQTCQPLECQYTLSNRNNPLLIFTTLLGLYGGLTYFLRFIVGQSLLAYRWWTMRNK